MGRIKRVGNGLRLYVRGVEKRVAWNHFQKVQRLFTLIATRTPVYTGTLRANWTVSYDRIPPAALIINTNPAMPLPPAEFNLPYDRETGKIRTIVITNRIPYVYRIEYGGWSNQAPYGVIRIAMREVFGV